MERVSVNREELLKTLIKNRDNHEQLYKDAYEGYVNQYRERLKDAIHKLDNEDTMPSTVHFNPPQNHTDMYDEVISIIEWDKRDIIELTRMDFKNYILDNWITSAERVSLRAMALSSSNSMNYLGE